MTRKAQALALAQRTISGSKPGFRTLQQLNDIVHGLSQQSFFAGFQRDHLIALAYYIEAKHAEAGELVLSKGQPLEHCCLLVQGSVSVVRYTARRSGGDSCALGGGSGSAVATGGTAGGGGGSGGGSGNGGGGDVTISSMLGVGGSWGEAALLHSSSLRRSAITVAAGPQGCMTWQLRYSDYDGLGEPRVDMPLAAPEGHSGPLAVPEITLSQRRLGAQALLCACIRRLASCRPPSARTPEEVSELEGLLPCLPAYRAYAPELIACMAASCRTLSLPPGAVVYELGNLADAQVTVMAGEVHLRRPGAGGGGGQVEECEEGEAASRGSNGGGSGVPGRVSPTPPAGMPGPSGTAGARAAPAGALPDQAEAGGARMSIRARLKKEREARKVMQRQLDDYVARMEVEGGEGKELATASPSTKAGAQGGGGATISHTEWTKRFMQQAARSAEPMWKALHPEDGGVGRRRHGHGDDMPNPLLAEEPITEVAQLLGPAAAKAYYRGLQSQGYLAAAEQEAGLSGSRLLNRSDSRGVSNGSGNGPTVDARHQRPKRWAYSVDGPETEAQRKLRNVAMHASRVQREQQAHGPKRGALDPVVLEEVYGPLAGSLTHGSPVGELSTVALHSSMRQESALAGASGCDLLLVDWEDYATGVVAVRASLLRRSASFLASLPPARLSRLAELCLCLTSDAGTLLARQGSALESLVVVQSGELQLLHEPPAATAARFAPVAAHAVSRTRNGRSTALPLLATLSQSVLPTAATAAAALSSFAPPPAGPSGPAAAAASGGGSGGALTEVAVHGLPLGELGIGGIVGEAILGIHGSSSTGSGSVDGSSLPPPAAGSLTALAPLAAGQGAGASRSPGENGPDPETSGREPAPAPVPSVESRPESAANVDGPKWAATVLTSKPSVLLVIQKSVLYMQEFDFVRGELMRYAAHRRAWLARRVEAAYQQAATAALATPPAPPAPAPAPPPPPAPGAVLSPSPSMRRSMYVTAGNNSMVGSAAAAPAAAAAVAAAADEGDGGAASPDEGGVGSPRGTDSAPLPSVSTLTRLHRPSIDGPYQHSGAASGGPRAFLRSNSSFRPSSKWDFLDNPTSALSTSAAGELASEASAVSPTAAAAAALAGSGSFGRSPAPPSPGTSQPGGLARSGSMQRAGAPTRGASYHNVRATKDAPASAHGGAGGGAGAGPPVDALVAIDLELDDGPSSSGGAEGRRLPAPLVHSGLGAPLLPSIAAANAASPFVTPRVGPPAHRVSQTGMAPPPGGATSPAVAASAGGPSSTGSAGAASSLRSPAAAEASPPARRSLNGLPATLPPALSGLAPVPELGGRGAGTAAIGFGAFASGSRSLGYMRASYSGQPVSSGAAAGRSGDLSGPGPRTRVSDMGGGLTPIPGSPALGTAPAPGLSAVPGLSVLDVGASVEYSSSPVFSASALLPTAGGFYNRTPRGSYSGGSAGRLPGLESSRQAVGSFVETPRRSGVLTGSRGGSLRTGTRESHDGMFAAAAAAAAAAAEAEEEACMARSLVPSNKAGTFMLREGASSTPGKGAAARRIANCF